MLIAGLLLAVIAALVHVYIFVLESVRWMAPSTRRTFGIATEDEAAVMKQLAFNQGFYNLFLAIATLVGAVVFFAGSSTVGVTLMLAGTGMMLLAAIVLVSADRGKLRAAVLQGAFPLLAVIALLIGIAVS